MFKSTSLSKHICQIFKFEKNYISRKRKCHCQCIWRRKLRQIQRQVLVNPADGGWSKPINANFGLTDNSGDEPLSATRHFQWKRKKTLWMTTHFGGCDIFRLDTSMKKAKRHFQWRDIFGVVTFSDETLLGLKKRDTFSFETFSVLRYFLLRQIGLRHFTL